MTFDEALVAIAAQLGLDADALRAYAAEDKILGSWPEGNGELIYAIPYTADGKLLYALIRALRPFWVLESGTNHGGSANHILAALTRNGEGRLATVDINPAAGQHIAPEFEDCCDVVIADIVEYVTRPLIPVFDFIHEDASHEVHTVRAVYESLPHLSPEGCVILSHDTALGVGEAIRTGIKDAGRGPCPEYLYDGSPCGFSVWRYEGVGDAS